MIDPKLLERIRKLLALGASPNPNEAASAIAHAQRLMDEHGLSTQDLDVADIESAGASDPAMSRARTPSYEAALANTVAAAFGVITFIQDDPRERRRFVGPAPRAQLAAYCFVVLLRQLIVARSNFMARQFGRNGGRRLIASGDHFAEGWVAAVGSVIRRVFLSQREENALAVWMEQHGLVLRNSAVRGAGVAGNEDRARYDGFQAGSKVQLHKPMGGGAETRRLQG